MSGGRLVGVDAARGLAVLGMMTAHIVLTLDEKLVDGRSSILFATLAGVSLGLMTGGAEPVARERHGASRVRIALRALAILALGLLLSALNPPLAVILDDYGVCFLLLLPLLFAPRAVLLGVAAVLAVVGPMLVEGSLAAVATLDHDSAELAAIAGEWVTTGSYPAAVWLVFPLLGVAVARSDLRSARTRGVLVAAGSLGALLGYGAAAVLPGVTAEAHSGSTAEILGSGGVALLLVGVLSALLDSAGRGSELLRVAVWPLAAVGSMPLTIYTLHVLGMAAAAELAARLTGDPRAYPDWLLPAMILGAFTLAVVLRLTLRSGPLELLLRRLVSVIPVDREPGRQVGGGGSAESRSTRPGSPSA